MLLHFSVNRASSSTTHRRELTAPQKGSLATHTMHLEILDSSQQRHDRRVAVGQPQETRKRNGSLCRLATRGDASTRSPLWGQSNPAGKHKHGGQHVNAKGQDGEGDLGQDLGSKHHVANDEKRPNSAKDGKVVNGRATAVPTPVVGVDLGDGVGFKTEDEDGEDDLDDSNDKVAGQFHYVDLCVCVRDNDKVVVRWYWVEGGFLVDDDDGTETKLKSKK